MSSTSKLVIVSNRGPYAEKVVRGKRKRVRAPGGLVTALDPVLRRYGGVWVSAQEPSATRALGVADTSRRKVQPGDTLQPEAYEIAEVPLARSVQLGYYDGVSNAVLWPLLHSFPPTMRVGQAPWASYVQANHAFADVVVANSHASNLIWVHDFHLMLVPELVRARREKVRMGWFCHVPWPGPDLFGILPWREEILNGLLGADVLAFHTEGYARNFLDCIARFTEGRVESSKNVIRLKNRRIRVDVAPIGVPVDEVQTLTASPSVTAQIEQIRSRVGGRKIVLGVDRLDYTKGIPERILGFEQFLRSDRSARNRYVYVQIMVPSRVDVEAYARLKAEIDRLVGDVNGRFSTVGRVAIHYLFRSLSQMSLYAHYRAADVALVTPLRDGMNLVAQEYVANRLDCDGVLVLSEFAGAAGYLKDAVIVNPYNITELAEALKTALTMPEREQRRRMRSLRTVVHKLDVHRWAEMCIEMISQKS
ncbi:MAG: trehalose-6-phosphate synthase [Myxococcales bacterium]|nr:trehalose-6-phosphate synthase [Myxococcales bacterium]